MPEYLTPGVYVEETTFRSRSIEGVPTSTFGMTGLTEYGPVAIPGIHEIHAPTNPPLVAGPSRLPGPVLVTSFTEYERAFGGLTIGEDACLVALAARAFFGNGGRRLYVSRVFDPTMNDAGDAVDVAANFGSLPVPAADSLLTWKARWPGSVAERIKVAVSLRRGKNVLIGGELRGVQPGAAVEVAASPAAGEQPVDIPDDVDPVADSVRIVVRRADGVLGYLADDGKLDPVDPAQVAFHLTFAVTVSLDQDRVDVYNDAELDYRTGVRRHPRSIFQVLQAVDPADEHALVWLDQVADTDPTPTELALALLTLRRGAWLTGGGDGLELRSELLLGNDADPDSVTQPARGLGALAEIDDIAIVASPDSVRLADEDGRTAVQNLIGHCERDRYRIAIVDPPADSSISEVRRFRSQFDTKYGALYYPWLRIVDPTRRPDPGMPPPTRDIPPSGAVAGIYARSDIERGVHKAPANEVVLGITQFVTNVTYDRQAVLNPEGVNALRFFEGRANRVWGARTMSSDPEWKYVNVRRLFIYLEHSIDKSTQWAVFEPNNERLWGSVRQTIEDFLLQVWTTGALMGTKPEEAFFVRCDRTTMTQNDLDNGRLICLIGVAPTYPAEFVIFRIGQWTADSRRG